LVNLSVRSSAGAGDRNLAVGFVISGTGTKQVLIRGVGPGLSQFAVVGVLPDPALKLFNGAGQLVESNLAWGGSDLLLKAFNQVGAFTLPLGSGDSALLTTLAAGQSTAQVSSATNLTGVTLVEAYEVDRESPSAQFVNMSARAHVGTGAEALTIGFVISGNAPVTLLIRGIGPTLARFGVTGALVDSQLAVFDVAGESLAQNNDWGERDELLSFFGKTGAFPLLGNAKDAALVITLHPGQYSAQVTGAGDTTGIALVEIYKVP
jgi:hypothetical protein